MARRWENWLFSPLLVVPAGAAALGLVLVPFAITSTDHAAQFYGSLVAALVAAGAVIAGGFVQAHLTQIRDERKLMHDHKNNIVQIFGLLHYAELRLIVMGVLYSDLSYRQAEPGRPTGSDKTKLTASDIRALISAKWSEDWKLLLPAAAGLNRDLAARVIGALYEIAFDFEAVFSFEGIEGEKSISRHTIGAASQRAAYQAKEIQRLKETLSLYLAELEARSPPILETVANIT